jgi:Spy/CpxP family protein refolding chaperone
MEKISTGLKAGLIVILVFTAGFLAGIGAVATFMYIKGPPPPFFKEEMPEPLLLKGPAARMDRMISKLDLRPEQVAQIEPVLEQARNDLQDLRMQNRPNIRKIFERARQDIRNVLDEKQRGKFDKEFEKRRAGYGRGPRRFGKGMLPGRQGNALRQKRLDAFLKEYRDKLNLTDEQLSRLQPILKDYYREKYRANGRRGIRSMGDETQSLGKKTEQDLSDILTEDQMKIFRNLQEERRKEKPEKFRGKKGQHRGL